jgi:hypothetical protein
MLMAFLDLLMIFRAECMKICRNVDTVSPIARFVLKDFSNILTPETREYPLEAFLGAGDQTFARKACEVGIASG